MLGRFTPAYAGKIQVLFPALPWTRVHPRIRGEDEGVREDEAELQGSPPHTRGRSQQGSDSGEPGRFTPAYAGKINIHQ